MSAAPVRLRSTPAIVACRYAYADACRENSSE
jgi:hypothetical protein